MIDRRGALGALVFAALVPGRALAAADAGSTFVLADAQWKARLSPEAYDVLRHEGTEMPFSSPLDHEKRPGKYACAGCDQELFTSKTKFDSGTGWPSFWQPVAHAIVTRTDDSLGMIRTEVRCSKCDGHLGHVFDDGPPPTHLRYCMNGVAMKFEPGTA